MHFDYHKNSDDRDYKIINIANLKKKIQKTRFYFEFRFEIQKTYIQLSEMIYITTYVTYIVTSLAVRII